MLLKKYQTVGLLLLVHYAHFFVLLTANIEDVKKIARKLFSEPLADQIAEFIAKASGNTISNVSEENEENAKNVQVESDNEMASFHKAARHGLQTSKSSRYRTKGTSTTEKLEYDDQAQKATWYPEKYQTKPKPPAYNWQKDKPWQDVREAESIPLKSVKEETEGIVPYRPSERPNPKLYAKVAEAPSGRIKDNRIPDQARYEINEPRMEFPSPSDKSEQSRYEKDLPYEKQRPQRFEKQKAPRFEKDAPLFEKPKPPKFEKDEPPFEKQKAPRFQKGGKQDTSRFEKNGRWNEKQEPPRFEKEETRYEKEKSKREYMKKPAKYGPKKERPAPPEYESMRPNKYGYSPERPGREQTPHPPRYTPRNPNKRPDSRPDTEHRRPDRPKPERTRQRPKGKEQRYALLERDGNPEDSEPEGTTTDQTMVIEFSSKVDGYNIVTSDLTTKKESKVEFDQYDVPSHKMVARGSMAAEVPAQEKPWWETPF